MELVGVRNKKFLDFYSKDNDDLQVIGTEIMSGVEDRLIKEKQWTKPHDYMGFS